MKSKENKIEYAETGCCSGTANCCADDVGDVVKRLVRVCQLFERDQIKVHGVTTSQCYCLIELHKPGRLTMYELSVKLNLKTSTVTRLIDNLVRDGFVERDHDENDRRIVLIKLTQKGSETSVELEKSIDLYYKKIMENIPFGQLDTVLSCVSTLLKAFDAANPNCC